MRSELWRIALPLAFLALSLPARRARGDMLPVWAPAELTRQSDLVVIVQVATSSWLRVVESIKGDATKREFPVGGLSDFSHDGALLPPDRKIEAGSDAILFLSQRESPPRVVGNGVYPGFWDTGSR
jgi:hypothetical protein